MVHPYLWIAVVGGVVCFLVACGNGANDLSNAFGTSYGSRVLTLLQIIILATGCEFAGAAGLGSSVTKTMSSGIAKPETFANEPYILMYGFLCALAGTAIWLILATWKDLTVSSHQSIAGGIIGFALVYGGKDAVIWAGKSTKFPFVTGVVPIVLSWIISPLLAGSVASIIYAAIRYPLLNRRYAVRVAPLAFPLIACITAFLEFLFIFFIAAESKLNWTPGHAAWVAAVIGVGIGVVCIPLVPLMKRQIVKMERQAESLAEERHISVFAAMREILAGGRPIAVPGSNNNINNNVKDKNGHATSTHEMTDFANIRSLHSNDDDDHHDNDNDNNNNNVKHMKPREQHDDRESSYYSPREGASSSKVQNGSNEVNQNTSPFNLASTSAPVEVRRVRKPNASHAANSQDGVKSLEAPSAAEGAVVQVENSDSSSDDDDDKDDNNEVNDIANVQEYSTSLDNPANNNSNGVAVKRGKRQRKVKDTQGQNGSSTRRLEYNNKIGKNDNTSNIIHINGEHDGNASGHVNEQFHSQNSAYGYDEEGNNGNVNYHDFNGNIVELDDSYDMDGVKLYDPRAEYIFRSLQIFTAACMSIAHGANDVSNSIGPFSAIYGIYAHGKVEATATVPLWLLCMGGAGIVVGLATYGVNIMRVLGEKLAVITPARGFSAELSTALVVSFATIFGIPISSTHCITGAVIGISIMDVGIRHIRWRIIGRMYIGWISTLLITGVISAAFFAQGINTPKSEASNPSK